MIEYYKNLSLENLFYIDENGIIQEEIWKDIEGWVGFFKVSNIGRTKSVSRVIIMKNSHTQTVNEKILSPTINKKGYLRVCFSLNNKGYNYSVHRLVAMAFIPNPLNLPEVNHKGENPNKFDNRSWMLEWCTSPDNRRFRSLNEKSTSKYVGVCFDRFRNKWTSLITINKKKIRFGRFNTELEAYMARYNYEIENNIHNAYRQEP